MDEILDDPREISMDFSRKSREEDSRMRVLGALAIAMRPVIEVADAVQASKDMHFLSIEKLQNKSKRLTRNLDVCKISQLFVLKQEMEVLQKTP